MCGRFARRMLPESYERAFEIEDVPNLPSYNVAPTQPVVVVRMDEGRKRPLAIFALGGVSFWLTGRALS